MAGNFHEHYADTEEHAGPGNRSFGYTVGGILAAIAVIKYLVSGTLPWGWASILVIGLVLLLLAFISPGVLTAPNRWWMKFGGLLAAIVNPIILFLMFAIIFVPLALVFRVMGRDALRIRNAKGAATYWINREPPGPEPGSSINQF